uniref:Uncharacterized protein n=1 Tax=Pararge aegeria TaxID=116150 RepID=S4NRX5_9NEOP
MSPGSRRRSLKSQRPQSAFNTFFGSVGDSNSSSSRLDSVEHDEHAESADKDLDLSQSTSSSVAPTAIPSE